MKALPFIGKNGACNSWSALNEKHYISKTKFGYDSQLLYLQVPRGVLLKPGVWNEDILEEKWVKKATLRDQIWQFLDIYCWTVSQQERRKLNFCVRNGSIWMAL